MTTPDVQEEASAARRHETSNSCAEEQQEASRLKAKKQNGSNQFGEKHIQATGKTSVPLQVVSIFIFLPFQLVLPFCPP